MFFYSANPSPDLPAGRQVKVEILLKIRLVFLVVAERPTEVPAMT